MSPNSVCCSSVCLGRSESLNLVVVSGASEGVTTILIRSSMSGFKFWKLEWDLLTIDLLSCPMVRIFVLFHFNVLISTADWKVEVWRDLKIRKLKKRCVGVPVYWPHMQSNYFYIRSAHRLYRYQNQTLRLGDTFLTVTGVPLRWSYGKTNIPHCYNKDHRVAVCRLNKLSKKMWTLFSSACIYLPLFNNIILREWKVRFTGIVLLVLEQHFIVLF